MSEQRKIDVSRFVDEQKFSRFHVLIFVLCFLVVAMDGYDTAAIGYVAGSISKDWNITRAALGPVMSAALIGLGLGAFIGGPLSDKLGRKTVVVGSTLFFGIFSGLSTFATTLDALTILRLLTGMGLGAAMPNSVALMAEFAPSRVRSVTVNSQLVGFSAGLATAGALSAWLIPAHGWQSVFAVGGVVPLIFAVALIWLLPESPQFLVMRGRPDAKIAKVLKRLAPTADLANCTFTMSSQQAGTRESRRWLILSRDYRVGTLVLWVIYFANLLVFYLLTGWLPILFRDAGFSLERAALVSSIFPIGGIIGAIAVGYVMDHLNPKIVIGVIYTIVAVMAVLIGQALTYPVVLGVMMFLTGALITSASTSLATIAASYYSADCRSTGVSWMFTVGRFGAVFGTFLGASLTALGWKFGAVFALLAVPSVVAAAGLFILAKLTAARDSRQVGHLNVKPDPQH
ncbi:MFS transporter [Burkholderia multivorans]|uniref:MFS transporter n=1 Tax=Burkholderia multivorans TaxID=87883 RepID=UPI001C2382BA|nr:MFS transporter [Burkholderia multivorans]MBU9477689.1 MFS transporter [Burkholderia multivorans]